MQIRLHYIQGHSIGLEAVSSCRQIISVKGSGPSNGMVSYNATHVTQVYKVMPGFPLGVSFKSGLWAVKVLSNGQMNCLNCHS